METVLKRLDGSRLTNPAFMYHVANDIEFETSASISQLSAKHAVDDDEFEGREMLILSGYQKFAQYLVDNHKI